MAKMVGLLLAGTPFCTVRRGQDKILSTYARNVKIYVNGGQVTLFDLVRSETEQKM